MVFTEQDLNIGINPFDILNEATYVDGDALISPFTVSMVENSDIGGVVVRFSDVESISESYGCDYIDAMIAIAEENNVDPNYMAVVVDEADIIADPYIITELANVVVNPQSPYSLAYQFCEACLDCFLESGGDEDYLDIMINEVNFEDVKKYVTRKTSDISNSFKDTFTDQGRQKDLDKFKGVLHDRSTKMMKFQNAIDKTNNPVLRQALMKSRDKYIDSSKPAIQQAKDNVGRVDRNIKRVKVAGAVSGLAALAYKNRDNIQSGIDKITGADKVKAQMVELMRQAQNKPKSWIGQKIASLRNMYHSWLNRANMERDMGQANIFKRIAATIMNCIDTLMEKLQNAAG